MRLPALALALLSCTCAAPPEPAAVAPSKPAPAQSVASTPATPQPATPQPASPQPSSPPTVATRPESAPVLGRDHRSVVPCSSDADCGWDDPCKPTRCVESGITATCKDSAPPPGACRCVAGGCTLQPAVAPAPSGTCEVRGCVVDRAAGSCVEDTGGVPENIRATPGVDQGPSCDCITPSRGCTFTWFAAVACKSDRDCWVDPSPRRHPVARPRALRKRDFRPCEDGEVAPRCGAAGTCVLGPAYSC